MDIMNFIKEDLKIRVKVNEDGCIGLNLKDIADEIGAKQSTYNKVDYYNFVKKLDTYEKKLYDKSSLLKKVVENNIDYATFCENTYINESLFYFVCIRANTEKAIKFQLWICEEVLPSLRENGFYIDEENLDKEKFEKLEKQFEKLKLTMFDICEMGKISLGKASELLLGNKHELKERFVGLGWLDYDKCQVVQKKFKASNEKIYELFVYNVSGTYDRGVVSQQLQVSLTNAGFIWLKDKLEQDKDFGNI